MRCPEDPSQSFPADCNGSIVEAELLDDAEEDKSLVMPALVLVFWLKGRIDDLAMEEIDPLLPTRSRKGERIAEPVEEDELDEIDIVVEYDPFEGSRDKGAEAGEGGIVVKIELAGDAKEVDAGDIDEE